MVQGLRLSMMNKSNEWKSVKYELPNENDIPYTTHVAVSCERSVSDKVLIVTKDAEVYTAFFMHTGKRHPYYGSCIKNEWSYPPHFTPFEAGWECCADRNGWGERYEPLFWTELPFPYDGGNAN